jgi:hypothetical protein
MKRFIILVAIIVTLITPIKADACMGGGLMSEAIHLPSTVTIYNPVKAVSVGSKVERATIRHGKIVFKDGRKFQIRKQFRNILQDGDKVKVYRKRNRITKIVFKGVHNGSF